MSVVEWTVAQLLPGEFPQQKPESGGLNLPAGSSSLGSLGGWCRAGGPAAAPDKALQQTQLHKSSSTSGDPAVSMATGADNISE